MSSQSEDCGLDRWEGGFDGELWWGDEEEELLGGDEGDEVGEDAQRLGDSDLAPAAEV